MTANPTDPPRWRKRAAAWELLLLLALALLGSAPAAGRTTGGELDWKRVGSQSFVPPANALVYFRVGTVTVCRELESLMTDRVEVREELEKRELFFVNADDRQVHPFCSRMGVHRVPTLILFSGGGSPTELARHTGPMTADALLAFLRGEDLPPAAAPAASSSPTTDRTWDSKGARHIADRRGDAANADFDLLGATLERASDALRFSVEYTRPIELTSFSTYQFYVDGDGDSGTGYQSSAHAGAEYMVEGTRLYRFAGSNPREWNWEFLHENASDWTGNVITYTVTDEDVGGSLESARVWAQAMDLGGTFSDAVPDAAPLAVSGQSTTTRQTVKAPADTRRMNKLSQEEATDARGDTASMADDITGVSLFADASNLIVTTRFAATPRLEGLHVYFDTDGDTTTGYETAMQHGADMMIEGQQLYRHSGAASAWQWSPILSDTQPETAADSISHAVPFELLNLRSGSTLRVWVGTTDTDWAPADWAPQHGPIALPIP
ncbi:MAG: thioredoxin family protein [Sumerlaeia bacterium]